MNAVVGRDDALAKIERFLTEARHRYVALVLEGEPGIGKTTLWRDAVRRAEQDGFRIVACRAAQAEAKLAFAALSDLLGGVEEDALSELPEPQRGALDAALLRRRTETGRIDPRAVAAALASVLARLAETSPLLVAIDDVQWLDRPSAAALSFALRRLDASSSVGVLGAVRLEESNRLNVLDLDRLGLERIERVRIGPLNLSALYHVIRTHVQTAFARPTLQRIEQTSRGNPLFALEIARVLAERGVPPVGEPLPVPADVEALLRRRVRTLPVATREVLLAAASLAEPRAQTIRAALGRAVEADLEPAERAQIVEYDGDQIRFAHPLLAAAIAASATAAERRRCHRRLSKAVTRLEERARHLALATEGRDESVATVVQAAAQDAFRRGAPAAAAELVDLSLRLGEPGDDREATRLLDRADYLSVAGEAAGARDLIDEKWQAWTPDLQLRAVARLCSVICQTEEPKAAIARFEAMLGEAPSAPIRAALHAWLSYIAAPLDAARAAMHADAALRLLDDEIDDPDDATCALAWFMQIRSRLLLGFGIDTSLVERLLATEDRLPRGGRYFDRGSYGLGYLWKFVDDLDASRRQLERDLLYARDSGEETLARFLLQHLAVTECWAGNLELAQQHAREASGSLATEPGTPLLISAAGSAALVAAYRGNAEEVRSLCAEQRAVSSYAASIQFDAALGLAELAVGDHGAADAHLRSGLEAFELFGLREPGIYRIHADAAEAAVAVGDIDRAEQIADFLEAHGRHQGRRSSAATGARVRALIAAHRRDLGAALAAADTAVAWHQGLPMPFELGRTLLVKGVIERRLRRRRRAKASLEQALEIFAGMGARLWEERARGELGRLGLRRAAGDDLTESERRVAELTARGLTRREVAAQLFVSPKTVDATLARAYRKLGVRSRAELGARMVELVQR